MNARIVVQMFVREEIIRIDIYHFYLLLFLSEKQQRASNQMYQHILN